MVGSIRFGGLASGMDTENMIKQLMQAERYPLNKLNQKKQTVEWKRDAYRDVSSMMLELRNSVFDLRFSTGFNKQKATTSDESKVGVTLTGSASASTYTVSDVNFATPATGASVKFSNSVATGTTKLSDAGLASDFSFDVTGASGTATINVTTSNNIQDVISKINAQTSTTGVTATYSATDKSIVFSSKTTGSASAVTISNVSGANPLNIANGTISNTTNSFGGNGYAGIDGTTGSVKVNGVSYTLTSNTLELDGMKLNLKEQGFTGSVTISVEKDIDGIYNGIKSFVDKYNEVIDKLNTKLSEKPQRDFQPLLEDQKEEMTEKQIEQWEAKAKTGLLRRDSILSNAVSEMRRGFYQPMNGASSAAFDTLSEIGIGPKKADPLTARLNSMESGKIYIDEQKLKDAIRDNPDKVEELFTKQVNYTDASGKTKVDFEKSGLAVRIYNQLSASMDEIKDKAGISGSLSDNSTLSQELRTINQGIYKWEDRLTRIEDNYWRQFTAMEKALSQMNQQSSWLSQQLGSGQ
ncbi:flagellar filament capping protein FliD [Brevibacillus dissolubilis]|uniref:flagellar filament capping protein FliD n=1 Tax=Brevibacillus dissolubilis TaxID=1844116 RepID=UPI001115DFAD|nr:flagellar filament capping protein FliD [Brevibacillus dissolubilis]